MPLLYDDLLRAEATHFRAVLADSDPSTPVPTCPGWTADDLLWHVGEVFTFWGTIVRDRLAEPDPAEVPESARPADHAGLLAFYDAAVTALTAALAGADDDVHVWTWSGDESVGFVRRRMAHESLIHRLDAEAAVGTTPARIDPDLAADGVHEALQHMYGGYPDWATWSPDGPVGRLRATDTGAAWTFRLGGFSGLSPNTGKSYADEPSLELLDESEPPAFTLSAPAAELDAWLWNRPAPQPALVGDSAACDRFRALLAKGVQ